MKRGRVAAAIALVAIMAAAAAFVWFRSRPRLVRRDVGWVALSPSGELVVATDDPTATTPESGIAPGVIARLGADGATTTLVKVPSAYALAVSSTHVFWTERGLRAPTTVRGVPIAGGATTTLGASMSNVTQLAASNDHVFYLKETGAVMLVDKEVAHDARCIAADDAGAFAATSSGIVRLDDGAVAFPRSVSGRCALLLSPADVFLATWAGTTSTLERAPRAGGAFERVRTASNVAAWYLAGARFVWTSVESFGKDRHGYEVTGVLIHVVRGNKERVISGSDTMWVGLSGDTLYFRELDGLYAVTLR